MPQMLKWVCFVLQLLSVILKLAFSFNKFCKILLFCLGFCVGKGMNERDWNHNPLKKEMCSLKRDEKEDNFDHSNPLSIYIYI